MLERLKLTFRKLIWSIIFLLSLLVPSWARNAQPVNFTLLDTNGFSEYSESLDYSTCEIEFTFNQPVADGYATISFYDSKGLLLTTETGHFSPSAQSPNVASCTFYFIEGDVESFNVEACDIVDETTAACRFVGNYLWIATVIFGALFFQAWLCNYKVYRYYDLKISVYAGYYHNYITVNGQKMDEHNTFQSFAPIYLSCTLEDGTLLNVTISTLNRIVLKINNQLYKNGF